MSKEVILTGLRANNDLTIGNYFGAILPIVDMAQQQADTYQINMFVPDLHSFTTPIDHSKLQAQIRHTIRLFVAAGLPLDNPDIHIYRQSYISAHSELTWILDCFTGFGEMRRMTQFKDKSQSRFTSQDGEEYVLSNRDINNELEKDVVNVSVDEDDIPYASLNVSVGLFNYPILMAADILLYGATYVPVGDDQSQHLEFTRDIAERMNNRFGDLFTVPKSVKEQHQFFGKDQGLRIKDLQDPHKKMSKSDESDRGVIFLGDEPEAAAKKIMSATTDSIGNINFDWEQQPGITNLLQILALASHRSQEEVNSEWIGKTSYGDLKSAVAAAIKEFLTNLQARLTEVDDAVIDAKLTASEALMTEQAGRTLLNTQKAVGLR